MVLTNWLNVLFDPVWLSLAAVGIALTAAWVVWRARPARQPQELPPTAAPAGRETATRLDLPVTTEVGGFLEVVSGDETLAGKMIPLYLHVCTTAGRSLEQAELVFNLHRPVSVVSRLHCEFDEINGVFRVRDLASTQGTFVNGMRLPAGGEGQILLHGDRLELGPAERGGVVLRFHSASIRLVRQLLQ
ncbi:MAG: FHA domain-containing protein [Anaerolineales bacterium]|jgi:hypothetical protein